MPRKRFENYFDREDWFILNKKQLNRNTNTPNFYWFVYFPAVLNLPSKAFNQKLHTKEDAIEFRNRILLSYLRQGQNNHYKDILRKVI